MGWCIKVRTGKRLAERLTEQLGQSERGRASVPLRRRCLHGAAAFSRPGLAHPAATVPRSLRVLEIPRPGPQALSSPGPLPVHSPRPRTWARPFTRRHQVRGTAANMARVRRDRCIFASRGTAATTTVALAAVSPAGVDPFILSRLILCRACLLRYFGVDIPLAEPPRTAAAAAGASSVFCFSFSFSFFFSVSSRAPLARLARAASCHVLISSTSSARPGPARTRRPCHQVRQRFGRAGGGAGGCCAAAWRYRAPFASSRHRGMERSIIYTLAWRSVVAPLPGVGVKDVGTCDAYCVAV